MSKLSAAHTRCYSAVVSLLLLLASATWAQPTVLNQQDWVLIKRAQDSESTRKSLDMTRIPNNPHQAQARQQANDLLAQLQATNPTMRAMQRQHAANAAENHYRMLVFVSRSLGEAGLAEVLRAVSGQPDAVLVFRGVPEQMSFGQAVLTIQRMAASYDPVPNIMINPLLFTQYNVTAVPTIVMLAQNSDVSGHSLPALAQVSGLNDPAWLIREVRGGATGDLGVKGPVAAISEPDLIELAKTRMAKIDWAQKKQQALERFWRMQQFHSLAKATKARTRTVDPSVVVTKDIAAADGTVFVHAGTVMNPLCDPREVCLPGTRPFTQAVVVFD
ncbi:MAG: TrbC family F-type conjugative pilus assembly protein, partial [Plesiomonas sp.]